MCQITDDFKISLIEDGKISKTIESYVGGIKAFIEFLVESNYEVATINKKINSIHELNKCLVETRLMK